MANIMSTIEEDREIVSVLFDMIKHTELYSLKNTLLTQPIVEQIEAGKRFVIGQLIMLTTRAVDDSIITSTAGVISGVKMYGNANGRNITYKVRLILGKMDSKNDITNVVELIGDEADEKIDTAIPVNVIDYVKTNMLNDNTLTLKESLEISHIFYLENTGFKSLF